MPLSDADAELVAEKLLKRLQASPATLPHSEASNIAAAAARTTVQELVTKGLAYLGINPADADQVEQLKADLQFVRGFRMRSERVGAAMTTAIVNTITYGILILIALGFLFWASRSLPDAPHPPPGLHK